MRKQLFSLLITLVMLCGIIATANGEASSFHNDGLPIVDDTVELTFLGMNMNNTRVGRYDETDMMKYLEEQTNVHIVWDMIPQASWSEKKNLTIAGGELPDGFMGPLSLTADEAQLLGADGILIPLEELIREHAPTIQRLIDENPTYRASITSTDGHIYALTAMQDMGFDSFSASIIRKDWLEALGLEMPSTTDEFYEVLKAFKDNDMAGNGNTIPMSFLYQESADLNREVKREFEWIFQAFGVSENPKHIAVNDAGVVEFTAAQEGFREAVSYIHKLYSEGLIDPEIFTQDRTMLTNKIRQLNVGCYSDYRLKNSMASTEIQDQFEIMPALTGPHGDKGWLRAVAGMNEGAFALTRSCEHPEIAIRWLDYVNEPENNIQMLYGMFKPVGWNESEALVPSDTEPGKWTDNTDLRPESIQPNDWPWSAPIGSSPVIATKEVITRYIATRMNNVYKEETCAVYRQDLTTYPYNFPYRFTLEEIDELNLIQLDLTGYVYRKVAGWITGGEIDAAWEDYLIELEKLGMERYVELYQTAFDRQK